MARRDRDTDAQLAAIGWLTVRIWKHEDPGEAAREVDQLVRDRTTAKGERARCDAGVAGECQPDAGD